MKYVAKILEDGETVAHSARVHWIVYFLPVLWTATGIFFAVSLSEESIFLGNIMIAAGLFFFLVAFIRRRTTELAITDRRVIVKTGFIKRNTSELNRERVEGVSVNQSVLGRILGYGTVSVQGTGGGIAPVKLVADPIDFRRAVGTARG